MAIAIVATVGAADANSFVTMAEADTYLEARLNSLAWVTAVDPEAALVEATREVSALQFKGYRTDSVQALSWPRTGVPDPDAAADALADILTRRVDVADDVIPERVKDATIELALEFVRAGSTDIAGPDLTRGVVRKKVDVLETEWSKADRPTGLARFPRVLSRLGPLLAGGGREVLRS